MNCDLCGASDGTEIEPGIRVCAGCGFVYVPERRTPHEIAADWSNVYASGAYDPDWPGVKARLFYVAEWLDQNVGLAGRSVLDVGAGRGFFLRCVRDRGAHPVGLEPDIENVNRIRSCDIFSYDIFCHHGAIEDHANLGQFDLVTILWTLENCGDCLAMLRWARNHLAPGGKVVVATGSRILVPFKKSYSAYMGTQARDLHCFRWEQWTLMKALDHAEMSAVEFNDFKENDVLLAVAQRTEELPIGKRHWFATGSPKDIFSSWYPKSVVEFFRQWKAQWP